MDLDKENLSAIYLTNNYVAHNIKANRITFTKSSRRHRIGKKHALWVVERNNPVVIEHTSSDEVKLKWIGDDSRGVELEIIGFDSGNELLIIHVMPFKFRRRK